MALVVANRVQETTTTAGTGTITLAGASAGYQSFAVIGNGNTTYYTIVDGNNWEVGIGTYTASGTTLSRDTVLASSASGTKITLSGNAARVFVDYPAEKAVYQDGSGNVGIGTTTVNARLSLGNLVSNKVFALYDDGTNQYGMGIAGSQYRMFAATSANLCFGNYARSTDTFTETVRITSAGNVGIGTSSPQVRLDVNNGGAAATQWIRTGTGFAATLFLKPNGSGGGLQIQAESSETATIYNTLNSPLAFGTNNTERARIDSSGNLGIGTSSPGAKLQINSQDGFRFDVEAGSASTMRFGSAFTGEATAALAFVRSANAITFSNGATGSALVERMRIDSAGNVGIGTLTPGQKLTVAGTVESTTGGFKFPDGTTQASAAIAAGIEANPQSITATKSVNYGEVTFLLGTIQLTATTELIFTVGTSSNAVYATVYDASSDTMGAPVSIGIAFYGVGAAKISDTAILFGYGNNSGLNARVLSISGTTITANPVATIAGGTRLVGGDPILVNGSYVFATDNNTGTAYLVAATVSGTTVTFGSNTTITTASDTTTRTFIPLAAYSATTGFVAFYSTATSSMQFRGFSVSGTTITLGSAVNSTAANRNLIAYYKLSSGRFIVLLTNGTSATSAVLVTMSGTTVTVSATSTTLYIAPTASDGFNGYSLIVNDKVLFATGTGAIVFRDNAGTISASSIASFPGITASTAICANIAPYGSTGLILSAVPLTASPSGYGGTYVVTEASNAPVVTTYLASVSANANAGGSYGMTTVVPRPIFPTPSGLPLYSALIRGGFYTEIVKSSSNKYYSTKMSAQNAQYPFAWALNLSSNSTSVAINTFLVNQNTGVGSSIDQTVVWYTDGAANAKLYRVKFS